MGLCVFLSSPLKLQPLYGFVCKLLKLMFSSWDLQMSCSNVVVMVVLSSIFFASSTHQLRSYETQILLQLRKHLEYPMRLADLENYNGDFCNLSSPPQISIKCENNSIIELRIMGDKPVNVSEFIGFAIPNQTLSGGFSIDSFVTTLTRLTSLRVLSLVSLGIWGTLPDKIHRLYSLEALDMSSNFIFGSIPSEMSRLVKLQTFTLDGNFFNDTIPEWLNSLTNLTVLSLKNNRFKGQIPSTVPRITTLTEVVLSHNLLSGKLPDLSSLSNLRLLDLRENHLDSQLSPLPKGLTNIFLSNNSFSGSIPDQLGKLNELQRLDLSNNHLSGMPPTELFSMPNINYLNLSSNMLSGSLSQHLKCGDALSLVDISDNRLIGVLPTCLDIDSDKRVVKTSGNCLSFDTGSQHPESYCKDTGKDKGLSSGKKIALFAAVIGGIVAIVVLLSVSGLLFFCKRHKTERTVVQHFTPKILQDDAPLGISAELLANARIISQAAKLGTQSAPAYRVFSIEELGEATDNFDPLAYLGESPLGKVYKGRLANGTNVAIRSLALCRKYSIQNLKQHLDLLSKLRHPHLVGLIGHCIDGGRRDDSSVHRLLLVYEFVPNGNFCAYLSDTSPEKALKWSDRLGLLIGVSKAVHFLHTGVIPPCYNNRLKTNNILLDEHRIAKLSDYGISIITDETEKAEAKGDVSKSWRWTKLEDDVYNFGFILLESIVGPIASGKREAFLLNEMTSFGSQDGMRKIVDPIVLSTSSQESLSIVVSLTNKCILSESSSRPSFEDVLWNLQYAAQVQATVDLDQKSDTTSQSELQLR